jgi:hypothetical protein
VTFAEVTYRLRFRFHPRCEKWYLDLLEPDDTPILLGTPIVIGWPLWQGHQDLRIPNGLMMAFDMIGDGEELTTQEDQLGDTVRIDYVPRYELTQVPSTAESLKIEPVP